MLREVFDPAIVNQFSEVDISAGVRQPNVFLFGEHGGFCWGWSGPKTYEGHVMLTPEGRGQWGVRAGRQAIEIMAMKGAKHLWCRVDPSRPEIGVYAASIGFTDTKERHLLDPADGIVWRIFEWRA